MSKKTRQTISCDLCDEKVVRRPPKSNDSTLVPGEWVELVMLDRRVNTLDVAHLCPGCRGGTTSIESLLSQPDEVR